MYECVVYVCLFEKAKNSLLLAKKIICDELCDWKPNMRTHPKNGERLIWIDGMIVMDQTIANSNEITDKVPR